MTPEELLALLARERKRNRLIMTSWGLAVLVLAGLFSARMAINQRAADHDMCGLIGVFQGGPEPVAGPAGDRARVVRRALDEWSGRRHCPPR